MEPAFDMLELSEELRVDYRKHLEGLTPSLIASMGIEPSIDKLEQLNLPLRLAYACFLYERGKSI